MHKLSFEREPTMEIDHYLQEYNQQLEAAEAMLPLLGKLWRTFGVHSYVFGQGLHLKSPSDILNAHREARHLAEHEVLCTESLAVLEILSGLDLGPSKIDLGQIYQSFKQQTEQGLQEFVTTKFNQLAMTNEPLREQPQDVVLYGFGRIGRLLARLLIERMGGGERFRLRAIVTRPGASGDLAKRADLLRRDSVHGPFEGTITIDEDKQGMIINGNFVQMIYSNAPQEVDYGQYGINEAIIIDNTGKWRDREGLGLHLQAQGSAKVILTAPAKGDIPNIVVGINQAQASAEQQILSAASCTTNAIAPVLKVVNDHFGISGGHMQSVHAYTNDQNLIDNYHKKERRGRSAAMNMVITETGAAIAVAKVCPELKGLLTANAIRVPTPNVSMAIISLNLKQKTTKAELNKFLRNVSLEGELKYQIGYTTSPDIVSTDLVGNRHASIVDSHATIVHDDGDRCTLYVWYDNEFGYACQVTRLLEYVSGLKPTSYVF